MPIYDYRCDHCGHTFSVVLSFNDAPVEVCPSCGKRPRKLLVTPAIVFKGSGWYKTDSRAAAKNDANARKPEPPAEAKTETKSDAKSEAKTDAKSQAKTASAKSETKTPPAKSEGSS